MSTVCKIENGYVVDRAVVADVTSWSIPGEIWIADEVAQIGWVYNGEQFIPPAPPLPSPNDVTVERNRRLLTFIFDGVVYDFVDGKGSDLNIAGAGTLALSAIVAGSQAGDLRWFDPNRDFQWIATDNTPHAMDAPTTLLFAKTAAAWKERHIHAARLLKDQDPIPSDFRSDQYWPSI